jgi:hypothetical protein
MSLADQLRESRSKHTLKNYEDAVKQLRAFRAVQPITGRKFGSSENTRLKEDSAAYRPDSQS